MKRYPVRRAFAARLLLGAIGVLAISSCSASPVAPIAGTSVPAATGTPNEGASAPLSATGGPATTVPPAAVTSNSAALVKTTQQFFRTWVDSIGSAHYEIVIEVTNTGGGYASLNAADESYTVYATDGTVLQTGTFTYQFPQVIGPGQSGYFVDSGVLPSGTKLKNVGKMDPSLNFGQADGPTDAYAITKVRISQDDFGTGLQASGVVTNSTSTAATDAIVGVIFFDGSGKIIGALYDNSGLGILQVGQAKGFKTSFPGTPPLTPSQVKKWIAFAFDDGF